MMRPKGSADGAGRRKRAEIYLALAQKLFLLLLRKVAEWLFLLFWWKVLAAFSEHVDVCTRQVKRFHCVKPHHMELTVQVVPCPQCIHRFLASHAYISCARAKFNSKSNFSFHVTIRCVHL